MTKIIIIVKNKFRISLIAHYFLYFIQKREITFLVGTFEGSLFKGGSLLPGFSNTFERVVTFET